LNANLLIGRVNGIKPSRVPGLNFDASKGSFGIEEGKSEKGKGITIAKPAARLEHCPWADLSALPRINIIPSPNLPAASSEQDILGMPVGAGDAERNCAVIAHRRLAALVFLKAWWLPEKERSRQRQQRH
jgi:hypothetical protein